jgi:outer membrane lipoprotein-sorting protein
MKLTAIIPAALVGLLIFVEIGIPAADRFDQIKNEYSSARMVHFDVVMVTISKIFDQTDSSSGEISIADDGRYYARVGGDIYLFDGRCIWEVSTENNQATKQCLKDGEKFENRLFFMKNLDDYFRSNAVHKNSIYHLIRNKNSINSLPDSMTIFLGGAQNRLLRIEYYDLNGDLNRIYISDDKLSDSINDQIFQIKLPDSTEVITLP